MSSDDEWSMLPELMLPKAPFDGSPVRLRLVSLTEIEARFAEPELVSKDPINPHVIQTAWIRSDGQAMPENDPPRNWKPA